MFNQDFGPTTSNLQKFFIRNLLPNISNVFKDSSSAKKLLENVFAITNFESFEELKKIDSSGLLGTSFDINDISNSNIFFLSADPYFTNIRYDFKIDKTVNYEQIFNAGTYLGLLKDPLINYALVVGGETIKSQINNFFNNLTEITSQKTEEAKKLKDIAKSADEKAAASREELLWGGFTEMLKSIDPFVAGATGNITNILQKIINFGLDVLSSKGATEKIFKFSAENIESLSRKEMRSEFNSITLSSFFTAKIFNEVQSPFPKVTLTIMNVAQKSIDEHIPLINFIAKLITPLTLAAPIFPIQVIIFNKHDGKEAYGENPNAHSMVQFQNGLNPFTYTQSNVGYFNVTGINISGYEKSSYGTTDSLFYQKSGIPLPIVLKVTLTLEAFDPFYFNYFDPTAFFNPGSPAKESSLKSTLQQPTPTPKTVNKFTSPYPYYYNYYKDFRLR